VGELDEPQEEAQEALKTKAGFVFAKLGGIVRGNSGDTGKPDDAHGRGPKRVYRRPKSK
jgi:hypothetical protein